MSLLTATHAVVTATGSHHTSRVFLVLFGCAFIGMGLLNVLKPDASWRMSRWQFKNPSAMQPSAAGLLMARIGGGIAMCIGIAFIATHL